MLLCCSQSASVIANLNSCWPDTLVASPRVQDWEFPTSEDAVNYVSLLSDVRQGINNESFITGSRPLVFTVAVPSATSALAAGYNLPAIVQYVDEINVMTYDYHGRWTNFTAPGTPLYKRDDIHVSEESIDTTLKYMLAFGLPPAKLVIGIAVYGYSWKIPGNLPNSAQPVWIKYNVFGDSSAALAGPVSQLPGYLRYSELVTMCFRMHNTESASSAYTLWGSGCGVAYGIGDLYIDESTWTAYGVYNGTWMTVDTPTTVAAKLRYVLSLGVGGAFTWSAGQDVRDATTPVDDSDGVATIAASVDTPTDNATDAGKVTVPVNSVKPVSLQSVLSLMLQQTGAVDDANIRAMEPFASSTPSPSPSSAPAVVSHGATVTFLRSNAGIGTIVGVMALVGGLIGLTVFFTWRVKHFKQLQSRMDVQARMQKQEQTRTQLQDQQHRGRSRHSDSGLTADARGVTSGKQRDTIATLSSQSAGNAASTAPQLTANPVDAGSNKLKANQVLSPQRSSSPVRQSRKQRNGAPDRLALPLTVMVDSPDGNTLTSPVATPYSPDSPRRQRADRKSRKRPLNEARKQLRDMGEEPPLCQPNTIQSRFAGYTAPRPPMYISGVGVKNSK